MNKRKYSRYSMVMDEELRSVVAAIRKKHKLATDSGAIRKALMDHHGKLFNK